MRYQLLHTSPYLGGQIRWDIPLDYHYEDGTHVLETNRLQIVPLNDDIRFNEDNERDCLRYSHTENIKQLFNAIGDRMFLATGEYSINERLYNRGDLKDPYSHIYQMGVHRMRFQRYGKQFSFLCPLWISEQTDVSKLRFQLDVRVHGMERDHIVRVNIRLNDRLSQYLQQYLDQSARYLYPTPVDQNKLLTTDPLYRKPKYEGVSDDLLSIQFDPDRAHLTGVHVDSGKVITKDISYIIREMLQREVPLLEFDNILVSQFAKQHIVAQQLINLNFIFNIEDISYILKKELLCKPITLSLYTFYDNKQLELRDLYTNYTDIPVYRVDLGMFWPPESVTDYLRDNYISEYIHLNKFIQPIFHWSLVENPNYLYNMYNGFSPRFNYRGGENNESTPYIINGMFYDQAIISEDFNDIYNNAAHWCNCLDLTIAPNGDPEDYMNTRFNYGRNTKELSQLNFNKSSSVLFINNNKFDISKLDSKLLNSVKSTFHIGEDNEKEIYVSNVLLDSLNTVHNTDESIQQEILAYRDRYIDSHRYTPLPEYRHIHNPLTTVQQVQDYKEYIEGRLENVQDDRSQYIQTIIDSQEELENYIDLREEKILYLRDQFRDQMDLARVSWINNSQISGSHWPNDDSSDPWSLSYFQTRNYQTPSQIDRDYLNPRIYDTVYDQVIQTFIKNLYVDWGVEDNPDQGIARFFSLINSCYKFCQYPRGLDTKLFKSLVIHYRTFLDYLNIILESIWYEHLDIMPHTFVLAQLEHLYHQDQDIQSFSDDIIQYIKEHFPVESPSDEQSLHTIEYLEDLIYAVSSSWYYCREWLASEISKYDTLQEITGFPDEYWVSPTLSAYRIPKSKLEEFLDQFDFNTYSDEIKPTITEAGEYTDELHLNPNPLQYFYMDNPNSINSHILEIENNQKGWYFHITGINIGNKTLYQFFEQPNTTFTGYSLLPIDLQVDPQIPYAHLYNFYPTSTSTTLNFQIYRYYNELRTNISSLLTDSYEYATLQLGLIINNESGRPIVKVLHYKNAEEGIEKYSLLFVTTDSDFTNQTLRYLSRQLFNNTTIRNSFYTVLQDYDLVSDVELLLKLICSLDCCWIPPYKITFDKSIQIVSEYTKIDDRFPKECNMYEDNDFHDTVLRYTGNLIPMFIKPTERVSDENNSLKNSSEIYYNVDFRYDQWNDPLESRTKWYLDQVNNGYTPDFPSIDFYNLQSEHNTTSYPLWYDENNWGWDITWFNDSILYSLPYVYETKLIAAPAIRQDEQYEYYEETMMWSLLYRYIAKLLPEDHIHLITEDDGELSVDIWLRKRLKELYVISYTFEYTSNRSIDEIDYFITFKLR